MAAIAEEEKEQAQWTVNALPRVRPFGSRLAVDGAGAPRLNAHIMLVEFGKHGHRASIALAIIVSLWSGQCAWLFMANARGKAAAAAQTRLRACHRRSLVERAARSWSSRYGAGLTLAKSP